MKDFLKSAEEQLIFNKDKDSIITELSDHVETKKEFFESIGYDEIASTEKANEAMGNGEIVGQRLHQIHNRKEKIIKRFLIAAIISNVLLPFAGIPLDEDSFILPFFSAVLLLIGNFIYTALAIKFKSVGISTALTIFSCTTAWLPMPRLAYPFFNLIIDQISHEKYYDPIHFVSSDSFLDSYLIICIVITVCLNALILLPNIYNIYHCIRIRHFKNTKRQNVISTFLRRFCLIAAALATITAFPYYAMNEHFCAEQMNIRDELIDFALETVNKFDYSRKEELAEYLENCQYDFEHTQTYENYNGVYNHIEHDTFECFIGNWVIRFYYEDSGYENEYHAYIGYTLENSSQKYLYTPGKDEKALIEAIGDPNDLSAEEIKGLPNNVIAISAEEINDKMERVNIVSFIYGNYEDDSFCDYSWRAADALYNTSDMYSNNDYTFIFNKENVCDNYFLYIFELPEPVNWEDYT